MAGDVSHKQMAGSKRAHDEDVNEDEEADDGDGSMFEDLDEPQPISAKRSGKAKSPVKSGTMNWLLLKLMLCVKTDMPRIDPK